MLSPTFAEREPRTSWVDLKPQSGYALQPKVAAAATLGREIGSSSNRKAVAPAGRNRRGAAIWPGAFVVSILLEGIDATALRLTYRLWPRFPR